MAWKSPIDGDGVEPTLGEGRYQLVEAIGRGGMAEVWRARDTRLGVDVAIKVLEGEGRALQIRTRRLVAEARAMARIQHPHIISVHDVQDTGHGAYIVMDLVTGGTLEDRLHQRGPLPARRVVAWMLQVLDALHAAHQRGIVHRDVKPSNVLLDHEERPLLADFGIALLADEDRHTRTGISMGSVAFMAPEQRLDARSVGPTADVYSAACTIYHLVSGATSVDLFTAKPDSPRWEGVPPVLARELQRATSLDPDARPRDALVFAHELRELMDALPEADPVDEAWIASQSRDGTLGFGEDLEAEEEQTWTTPYGGTLAPPRTEEGPTSHPPPTEAPGAARARSRRRVAGWVAVAVAVLLLGIGVGSQVGGDVGPSAPSTTARDLPEAAGEVAAAIPAPALEPEPAPDAVTPPSPVPAPKAAPVEAKPRRLEPPGGEADAPAPRLPVEGAWRAIVTGVLSTLRVEVRDGRATATWEARMKGEDGDGEPRTIPLDGAWRDGVLTLAGPASSGGLRLELRLADDGAALVGTRTAGGGASVDTIELRRP